MPTILLLGASSDIAVAIAKKYASQNFIIQLAGRNISQLDKTKTDLTIRYGISCTTHEFDALKTEEHQAFFDSLSIKPDITICIFGYLGDQQQAETDWKEAEKIIGINFTGAVSILNVVANYYMQHRKGCIAGISSVAGERGRQSNYMYGSAKAGFTAYLSGLRNRLSYYKVHVLTVQPGFVFTKMTENIKLPNLLTAQPPEVANQVYKAIENKTNILYVKWFWRWIMLIIRNIPEFVFKKMKL